MPIDKGLLERVMKLSQKQAYAPPGMSPGGGMPMDPSMMAAGGAMPPGGAMTDPAMMAAAGPAPGAPPPPPPGGGMPMDPSMMAAGGAMPPGGGMPQTVTVGLQDLMQLFAMIAQGGAMPPAGAAMPPVGGEAPPAPAEVAPPAAEAAAPEAAGDGSDYITHAELGQQILQLQDMMALLLTNMGIPVPQSSPVAGGAAPPAEMAMPMPETGGAEMAPAAGPEAGMPPPEMMGMPAGMPKAAKQESYPTSKRVRQTLKLLQQSR